MRIFIENIVGKLDIDLYTYVVDWAEMRDLQQAFLRAGLANQDVPQGIVLSLPHIPIGVETSVVLTSFLAYGSSGDGSSIGPYTPIVARIYIPLIQNKSL